MFSAKDIEQIKQHGLDIDLVNQQVDFFRNGFPPSQLSEPALIGSGVLNPNQKEIQQAEETYSNLEDKTVVKFVPASGAATRMFKSLFAFQADYDGSDEAYERLTKKQEPGSLFEFFKRIQDFAFYEELSKNFAAQNGTTIEEAHLKRDYVAIVDSLLNEDGLNYGSLPKGLLTFHKEGANTKTPVEEHIIEGCQYAKQSDGGVAIHFTVSPEHIEPFKQHVEAVRSKYEKNYSCHLKISYSVQNTGTDTIAVSLDNEPFRLVDGSILFRPAGHGALLENLNGIDADIVFLKNIDNVVPDSLKDQTITYKKVIAGILLEKQEKIFDYLRQLANDSHNPEEVLTFISAELGYRPNRNVGKEDLISILNRPIRVCGMVKSEGDPGGGPFWVRGTEGEDSLQVVETAQIDLTNDGQKKVFNQATHFNPVDVVCGIKDFQGKKFDLMNFRDPNAGFSTEKSKDGKTLKAQELPGLWNGSMAYWNTIFVEVPVITFNPVKTVNDLLKPEHQG